MKAVILTCRKNQQFHLGINDLDNTHLFIHSDTLFSALVNCFATLFPDQKDIDLLCQQFKEGNIRISSAFPCLEVHTPKQGPSPSPWHEDFVFFLPKPICYHRSDGREVDVKLLKSIRFLSMEVWKEAPSTLELSQKPLLGGSFAINTAEIDHLGLEHNRANLNAIRPLSEGLHPKVRVHATDQANVFYHQAVVQLNHFRTKSSEVFTHYYFLLDEDLEGEIKTQWYTALHLLEDEGIGGERSSGKGQIASISMIEDIDQKVGLPREASYYANLSLLIPGKEEFSDIHQYEITLRGGGSLGKFQQAERHRRQIRMIKEGALMSERLLGRQVDLRPESSREDDKYPHPILRNGRCYPLAFNYEENR